ncbi:MAG TPA: hypothetical protein VKQ06_06965, partial [Gammaproteobacteria bacterium]|nr:hypothetical protein [Gammaproteobacteria bacterium]
DYENLSTPISDTAMALKQQLHDAGLHKDDDKRLTLLVHSMGGLVSRWLIEREGGFKFVDRLIMCGTPNVGSPFGKIDGARKLSKLLTTLAINSFPAFAVVGGALIYVLNKSEKLTPCLEQMNPDSDFITRLNGSEDPKIPYTILAADAREYREDSDDVAASLIAKLGRGLIFDTLYHDAAHDIAVSLQSILGVDGERAPAPVTHRVVGHHLNYFTNDDSLQILAAID